jgi:hypothetical protein
MPGEPPTVTNAPGPVAQPTAQVVNEVGGGGGEDNEDEGEEIDEEEEEYLQHNAVVDCDAEIEAELSVTL